MVLKQREDKHFSLKALKAVIYVFFFRFENAISNTLYHSILFYLMTFMSKIQENHNTFVGTVWGWPLPVLTSLCTSAQNKVHKDMDERVWCE